MNKPIDIVVGLTYGRNPNNTVDYLLLRTKKRYKWELPKGKVECGETPMDTLRREMEEETNCANLLNIKECGVKRQWRKTFGIFSVEVDRKEKINIDRREHNAYMWSNFNKSMVKLNSYFDKLILRSYKV